MSKPMIRTHDAETNEIIDREMTDKEFADYQNSLEAARLVEEQRQAVEKKKAEVLEKLGLSADDLAALLG